MAKRTEVGMSEADRSTITNRYVLLTKELKAESLLRHMTAIFDEEDCELVRSKPTSRGKAEQFLSILVRRGPRAFPAFRHALNREQPRLCPFLGRPSENGETREPELDDFHPSIECLGSELAGIFSGYTVDRLARVNDAALTKLGIECEGRRRIILQQIRRYVSSLDYPSDKDNEDLPRSPGQANRLRRQRAIHGRPSKQDDSPSENVIFNDHDHSYEKITEILREGIELLECDLTDKAYACLTHCLNFAKSMDPPAWELAGSAASHLGTAYCLKDDLVQAETSFQQSLSCYRKANESMESHDVAMTLHHLGQLLVETNRLEEAADWMEEYVSVMRKLESESAKLIPGLLDLRAVYQRQGLVSDEIVIMKEVLRIQKQMQPFSPAEVAKTLNELGALNVYKGEVGQAVEYFKECYQLASDLNAVELRTAAWENLSAYVGDSIPSRFVISSLPRRSFKMKGGYVCGRQAMSLPLSEPPFRTTQLLRPMSHEAPMMSCSNGQEICSDSSRERGDTPPPLPEKRRKRPPHLPPPRNRLGTVSARRTLRITPLIGFLEKPQSIGTDEFQDPRNPSFSLNQLLARKEIRPNCIRKKRTLSFSVMSEKHSGEFMDPVSGKLREVQIKTLKNFGSDEDQRKLFFIEGRILAQLNDRNITTLFGVVTTGREPMIITQYFKNGSVMRFFTKECASGRRFHVSQLLHMLMDVCSAMHYLAKKLCILRVVSSRAMYVTDDERCQITDFGFARKAGNGFCNDAHLHAVPLPWTAPESFPPTLECTTQSDVWGYGVFMWEVMSLCQDVPYKGIRHEPPFIQQVQDGLRPAVFKPCGSGMRKLMEECWSKVPQYRPSFDAVEMQLLKERQETDQNGYFIGPKVEFFPYGHFYSTALN